ncbi:MAG: ABC transporter permease subunit [Candidatus Kariarchaeaceae archaeon]|jgi:ABC-type transport system involved in multi-copper enzyme maturation permease subunit
MSQFYTVFKNETISNRGWFIGWLIGIGITVLMIGFIYPGDDGMASFVNLLEDEAMQAFFGAIGGTEPGYTLWVAIMFPFISIILFIFSINSGVKIVTGETDKRTGELVYVLPLSRRTFFFAKWLAMTFYLILIILFIFIGLITPINGYSVDFDRMLLLTLHTVVYTLSGVSIGICVTNFIAK